MSAPSQTRKASGIDWKVEALAELPGVSQIIETHMAYVFLTDQWAFKLKKPVRFDYFDHRTIPARAKACAEEVRLNRALAGDVYVQTLPLVHSHGRLSLGGEGRVVDWLVQMRRLPQDRMLDAVISAGQGPDPAALSAVVAHLAQFYRAQQSRPVQTGLYFAHMQREQRINDTHLKQLAPRLPDMTLLRVVNDLSVRLDKSWADIAARETAGLVVEGHGDLRPEHVCLTTPPVIFDRVETAVELRVMDVYDEVGFLASECAMLGRPDLWPPLMSALQGAGFAPPPRHLQTTYAMFRMVTRARLALDHLRDKEPRTPGKWIARTRDYLLLAIRLSAGAGFF